MPSRPVHWYEGMFLRPHHLQAADRHAREALRKAEDWARPFHYGFRHVELDRDAISNFTAVITACEARFKDGTHVVVPNDTGVDPIDLKPALTGKDSVVLSLAVPRFELGRANVEPRPTADGPRYWVDDEEMEDENTGGQEQILQVRRLRARLLLEGQDTSGYEVLPLARVVRSSATEAPPQLDPTYFPPLLAVDAWRPLWRRLQALHYQMGAVIEQLSSQVVDRGISFDSQVPGDAEALLKLATVNGAFSHLESIGYIKGLPPLLVYSELCRIAGQLAIFTERRRPPNFPGYDHDNLGGCFQTVVEFVQAALKAFPRAAFLKRFFQKAGERLQVAMDREWLAPSRSLYLGVESDLEAQECHELLQALDMKLGSGPQVERIFEKRVQGLKLSPVARPPRALPATQGLLYYQIDRDPTFWPDVEATTSLGIRLNLARASFQGDQMLSVSSPKTGKQANLQFALFVIGS